MNTTFLTDTLDRLESAAGPFLGSTRARWPELLPDHEADLAVATSIAVLEIGRTVNALAELVNDMEAKLSSGPMGAFLR